MILNAFRNFIQILRILVRSDHEIDIRVELLLLWIIISFDIIANLRITCPEIWFPLYIIVRVVSSAMHLHDLR